MPQYSGILLLGFGVRGSGLHGGVTQYARPLRGRATPPFLRTCGRVAPTESHSPHTRTAGTRTRRESTERRERAATSLETHRTASSATRPQAIQEGPTDRGQSPRYPQLWCKEPGARHAPGVMPDAGAVPSRPPGVGCSVAAPTPAHDATGAPTGVPDARERPGSLRVPQTAPEAATWPVRASREAPEATGHHAAPRVSQN